MRRLLDEWLDEEAADDLKDEVMRADGNGHAPRREFFRWFATRCPSLAKDGSALAARFRRELPCFIRADHPTLEMLAMLHARGMPLALLSNGSASFQTAKLRACGAMPMFRKCHRFFSGTLGFEKPDPRAFEAVIGAMGWPAGEILFVGDDPQRDIAGARAAGMPTCRIRRPDRDESGAEADRVINCLSELKGILFSGTAVA